MQSMTLEQLRAASNAGGVAGVTSERAGWGVPGPDRHAQWCRCRAGESPQQRTAPLRQSGRRLERTARRRYHRWPV